MDGWTNRRTDKRTSCLIDRFIPYLTIKTRMACKDKVHERGKPKDKAMAHCPEYRLDGGSRSPDSPSHVWIRHHRRHLLSCKYELRELCQHPGDAVVILNLLPHRLVAAQIRQGIKSVGRNLTGYNTSARRGWRIMVGSVSWRQIYGPGKTKGVYLQAVANIDAAEKSVQGAGLGDIHAVTVVNGSQRFEDCCSLNLNRYRLMSNGHKGLKEVKI
eukprot:scaffold165348_cov38-Prasinocladus_malaysianus.AAC.1